MLGFGYKRTAVLLDDTDRRLLVVDADSTIVLSYPEAVMLINQLLRGLEESGQSVACKVCGNKITIEEIL